MKFVFGFIFICLMWYFFSSFDCHISCKIAVIYFIGYAIGVIDSPFNPKV